MNVIIRSKLKGARAARGTVVVIDVLRATSVIASFLHHGAKAIYISESVRHAYKLKLQNPSFILAGERYSIRLPGFDYGNSAIDVPRLNVKGKTVILTTSNGTRGIANAAPYAEDILTGSFLNAEATVRYLKKKKPKTVTLVPMGITRFRMKQYEDEACARYLQDRLSGKKPDFNRIRKSGMLRDGALRLKMFGAKKDLEFCFTLDRFDVVGKVFREGNELVVRRI